MSSITLSCSTLNSLLNKAVKCCLKGGIDPQTEMIQITHKDNTLSMRTTDTRNVLVVKAKDIPGEDFDVVIRGNEFSKILPKQTVKEVTLNVSDSDVQVIGNGDYKFPIEKEGSGNLTFDSVTPISDADFEVMFDRSELTNIIKSNGKFIGTAFADPRICGYYFGDSVITTDTIVACFYQKRLFDADFEIYDSTFNLLDVMEDEKVKVAKKGDRIQFRGPSFIIDSKIHQASDEYPADELGEFLQESYSACVTVNVAEAKEVMERIGIFASAVVSTSDSSGVYMVFKEDGISVSASNGRANEIIPYKSKDKYEYQSCKVSPEDFVNMITIDGVEDITLHYGNSSVLKIVAGEVVRVLGYIPEDDTQSEEDIITEAMNPESTEYSLDSSTEFESEVMSSNDLLDANW